MHRIFPILILNARPAAGKSEIIHTLQQVPVDERMARFHIGPMKVFDDFPLLWAWFEEDDLLEQVFSLPRLHTTPDGYFLHEAYWHLLIRRLSLAYEKWRRDKGDGYTAIIEFSRGSDHGGYAAAYEHLSEAICRQAAALYVRVSFAESMRKNRLRFNPERPDSILQHGLSDEKMARLYRHDDWDHFAAGDGRYLDVEGSRIPFAVFENEDDVTTHSGEALYKRLETTLNELWMRYLEHPTL